MNRFRLTVTVALALSAVVAWGPRAARTRGTVDDDVLQPNVLLLGDSIRIGYAPFVRDALAGEADVFWPDVNCHATEDGLTDLEGWLGDRTWDVIHFNFGLHDLKYLAPDGEFAAPGEGTQVTDPARYGQQLDALVGRLEATGATLVWASTTPVPVGARGRAHGDAARYNAIAADVMARHAVVIDDLYAHVVARGSDLQKPADVHFTDEGYADLGEVVSASVRAALAARAETGGRHSR